MNSISRSGQQEKITNTNETVAQQCLNHAGWDLERAVDIFYQTPSFQQTSSGADAQTTQMVSDDAEEIFLDPEDVKQMNGEMDRIGPNGMLRLLNDINVDPSSVQALILAWKCNAETQCEFSQQEFRAGCQLMRVDSVEKMRNAARSWSTELNDTQKFKQLYQFAFNYAKSAASRFLDIDTSVAYWNIIFQEKDARVPVWIEFLNQQKTRGISRDTWNLFFDFLTTTMDDYSNYDTEGAWPVLIDEFVEYARNRS